MSTIAFLIFIYMIYLLVLGSFKAAVVSVVVVILALVLAFRYHFWYFQIRKRKLGCTFTQWFNEGLLGGRND